MIKETTYDKSHSLKENLTRMVGIFECEKYAFCFKSKLQNEGDYVESDELIDLSDFADDKLHKNLAKPLQFVIYPLSMLGPTSND